MTVIDLAQLFTRRDPQVVRTVAPVSTSAAARIALPLDLRSATTPAPRRVLEGPS